MSEERARASFRDDSEAKAFLRELGRVAEGPLPLGSAALALAALDRPRVDLERYHHHLAALAREVGDEAAGATAIDRRVAALNTVILGRYGYEGDTLTYEDLQNANLMRVIDRRKGLPVALGILYIHAARAQGWDMAGLAFPGHFLVRLQDDGARVILDPFNGGKTREAAELRDLLKAITGNEAELAPSHYAPVSDREVLLRLQNNLKLRLLESRQMEKALRVTEDMMLFAPDHVGLVREAGLINAELGNLRAAIAAFERFLALAEDDAERHRTAALLQKLKARLQ
ncbi:MAG TPA: transglutaminase-like domain-containing protein [Stellaceae bacterium]